MNNFDKKLNEYARLAVHNGVNVAENQYVVINCPINAASFGKMIMKEAYEAGALEVIINYTDQEASKIVYENSPLSVFESIPDWRAEQRNYYARLGAAMIHIISDDPEAFAGVSSDKLLASTRAAHKAYEEYYKCVDRGDVRWTIVAYPCAKWAKKIFPDISESAAVEKLWSAIFKTVRIGRGDTVKKWQSHDRVLKRRGNKLNKYKFDALHFTNSLGTDLTVGLVKGHIWLGGTSKTNDGRAYFANMPTEEIFTMPDAYRVDGTVYSAMPLSYRGRLIDKFSLTFKDGAVIDHDAQTGKEALTALLDTDEGSRRLGEVALIPYDSPISNLGILFYNTLFDENASCHLALGDCYPETVKNGIKKSREELLKIGGNKSANHVDFMFGTSDMNIDGIKDGVVTPIFRNGNFVF